MARLIGNVLFDIDNIPVIEQDILKYIQQCADGDFSAVIREDDRFEVFRHLSDYPVGLFAWYDFLDNASVLEVGAGFGERTGLFCQKCAQVTVLERSPIRAQAVYERHIVADNLTVYVGGLSVLPTEARYDYVIFCGLDDIRKPVEYFRLLLGRLKPGGVLLVATDNRYALRHFCGEHIGKGLPFAEINGDFSAGRFYGRQELLDMINEAGAESARVYYPLPDFHLPQLIYSDEYLPGKELKERLLLYREDNSTLLANEAMLYDAVTENGAFPFHANSFIIECGGTKERFSTAVYAALSTDRGRERAFATVLYRDDKAVKRPIFSEGSAYAKQVYEQTETLRKRGLPMIAETWTETGIAMPRVRFPMLSEKLREWAKKDKDRFCRIIDDIWQYILRSSEEAAAGINSMMTDENRELPWGPILKIAYLEIIPLNCFCDGEQMLFFDQEYIRENCPAKYVLFRALRYIYVFAPETEQYIQLSELQRKYDLTTLWSIFVKEENNNFLPKVRQHFQYRQFYRRTVIDNKQMKVNAALLGTDAAGELEYRFSPRLREIWRIQLGLLLRLKKVCNQYGLKYYMAYGTLLGAVRHGGFIPWDDDADIIMPREDFDKLQSLAGAFEEPYYLQTMENDRSGFYNGFMKLRNLNTTAMSIGDFGQDGKWGIWIDILPLDVCPKGNGAIEKKIERVKKWQTLLHDKVYGDVVDGLGNKQSIIKEMPFIKRIYYKFLLNRYSYDELCKHLKQELMSADIVDDNYLAVFTHFGGKRIFEREDYDDMVELPFESIKLAAPKGYGRALAMSVGRDYMQMPPLEKRRSHHENVIFNSKVSYRRYNELFLHMFAGAEGKNIIIFGAGLMLGEYLKKHGAKHKPIFVIDNDKRKWNTIRQGIEVRSPESLLTEANYHVIICSIHYRAIEKQLQEMGIFEYKIFVQKKEWMFEDEMKYGRER